jgi:nicotinamidase-related amidase
MATSRPALALAAAIAAASGAAQAAPARPLTLADMRATAWPALDPSRAALVIIDAQREYSDGRLKLEGMDAAVAEIVRLRAWAHAHAVPVIHIRQEGPATAPIFAAGKPGSQIVAPLTPTAGETVVKKTYPNAFNHTELDATLKHLGRTQLVLTGFMAHMCLDSTTRAAFDLDYTPYVVASATAERPLPDPLGSAAVSAAELRRITMTALNDRFARILPDAGAVTATSSPAAAGLPSSPGR